MQIGVGTGLLDYVWHPNFEVVKFEVLLKKQIILKKGHDF